MPPKTLTVTRRILPGGQILILRGSHAASSAPLTKAAVSTRGVLSPELAKALAKMNAFGDDDDEGESHWITKDGTHILIESATGKALSGSPEFRAKYNADLEAKAQPAAAPAAPSAAPEPAAAPAATQDPQSPAPIPAAEPTPAAPPSGPNPAQQAHHNAVDSQTEMGIHGKHAVELRRRAASLPRTATHEPKRAALERAAKTLDTMEEHGTDDSRDDLNMAHKAQDFRLGRGSVPGTMTTEGKGRSYEDFKDLRDRAESSGGQYQKAASGVPGHFQFPENQLHNTLEQLPEFSASPALLARGSELHAAGQMAPHVGGIVHQPEAAPAPAPTPEASATQPEASAPVEEAQAQTPESTPTPEPAPETPTDADPSTGPAADPGEPPPAGEPAPPKPKRAVKPGETPTATTPEEAYRESAPPPPGFPEPNEPLQTAAAVEHLDALGNPLEDRPYSAKNVAELKAQPDREGGQVSNAEALYAYAQELRGHADRHFEAAHFVAHTKGKKAKLEASAHRNGGHALLNAARDAEDYARDPDSMAYVQRNHDQHQTESAIGIHEGTGRGTITHTPPNVYNRETDEYAPRPLTEDEQDRFRSLNGYASPGSKVSKQIGAELGAGKGDGKPIPIHSYSANDLHSAIAQFSHKAVSPRALLAAAHAHAQNEQAVQPWRTPKGWKGRANGGRDLMPYQEYAASFAASKDAALLALDMGLGKTPTAIAAWSRCKDMGKVTKGMVFVPDSVRENWRNEIGKFTNHRVGMYRSQAEVRKMSPAAQQNYEREMADAELIICGHGAFVGTSEQAKHDAKVEASMNKIRIARGAGASQEEIGRLSNAHADLVSQNKERSDESNLEQLQRFGCDSLIMDEAHALKNPDSNRARDFENHLTGLKHRILLTGTPMPNTPTDLYHMIGRVKKGLVASSLGQFVQKYIDRTYGITETGHVWHRDDAYKNLDQLFHSAKPAMLALHARDPHVLAQQKDMGIAVPEGIHEDPRQLQMSGAQDELYRLFKQEGKDILNDLNPNGDSEAKKKALLMTLGQRMEQISIDPTMIKMEDINGDGIVASDRMHKIRGLLQRAQEETHAASGAMKLKEAARIAIEHHTQGGKGVVIHANYTQSIPSLRRALEAAGFHGDDILELSGETSKGNRQKHVDSFNNPNSRGRVMIVTSAAREGVNLQGNNDKFGPHNSGGGSLDIMLSHAWLPGDEDQARARIERIGQDQTTRHVVLHAVTSTGKETVDQVKYRRIKAKGEAIAQAVLGRPGERVEIPQTAFDDEAADATFRGDD